VNNIAALSEEKFLFITWTAGKTVTCHCLCTCCMWLP